VWSAADDRLLGTMPDYKLAKQLDCSVGSVFTRRVELGIKVFKSDRLPYWTPENLALLGTMTDRDLARQLGCHVMTVVYQRNLRGIKAFTKGRGAK
jgi:hypothetical protein